MKRLFIGISIFFTIIVLFSSCLEREELIVSDLASISSDYIIFGGGDVSADVVITRSGEENGTKTKVSSKQLVSEKGDMSLPLTVEVRQGIHRYEDPLTKAYITADTADITTLDAWCIYTNAQGAKVSYFKNVEDRKGNNNYIDSIGSHFSKSTDYIFYPVDGLGPYPWETDEGVEFNFYNVAPHGSGFIAVVNPLNNVVTFKYSIPSDASLHKDILVASPLPIGPDDEYFRKPVPLTFKHVMAGVNVKVGTMPQGAIQSIQLKGVYNKGEYKPDTHEWVYRSVNDGGVFNIDLTNVLPSDQEYVEGKELYCNFMMIPQQLYTGAKIVVTFKPAGEEKPIILEASIQGDVWEMNTTTNYLINISENYRVSIVPMDETLDSHYIITKVKISSPFDWDLKAVAIDTIPGQNGGTRERLVDVSVLPEAQVNTLAKQGFWTDKKVIKNSDNSYTPTDESARGDGDCSGFAADSQIVYVFIPENVTSNKRYIKLTLTGGEIEKQITLTQNPVIWLDPNGNKDAVNYLGCELLIEGGQVPWGFCWDGLWAYFTLSQGGGNTIYNPDTDEYYKDQQIPKGQRDKIIPAMQLAGINTDLLEDGEYYIQVADAGKSRFFISIDLSKLGDLDIADSPTKGYNNTIELFKYEGVSSLSQLIDFCLAWGSIENPDGRATKIQNSLDYAAMYAMKRNRFYYYEETMTMDNKTLTMIIPVLFTNDINWYLPAKDQFPLFMNTNWGQKFTFNDLYWTSTRGNDAVSAYSYLNGFESVSHRNDKYLTFAIRQFTLTDNIGIPIDPGVAIKPGDDITDPNYGGGVGGGTN